jgi:hypothetical protein
MNSWSEDVHWSGVAVERRGQMGRHAALRGALLYGKMRT